MPFWIWWLAKYLISFVALTGLASGLIIAIAKFKERQNPRAQATYMSIRAGGLQTFLYLIVGAGLSLCIGIMVWDLVTMLAKGRIPVEKVPVVIVYLPHLLGALLGFAVGYYGIFLPGRLSKTPDRVYFDIKPGEKAYLSIAGVPFGNLGPGWAWRMPWLMDYKLRETAAHQASSAKPEEYLTGNGTEMFIGSAVTVVINDPLLAEGVSKGDIPGYLNARREAAVRRLIGEKELDLKLAFKKDQTPEEQQEVFEKLVKIKGDVSKNGPSKVLEYINAEIGQYGMWATQAQFTEVLFNDQLESKIQRAFDEIAEGPGLQKDALNKAAMVKIFYDLLLKLAGLKEENLTTEQRLAFIQRAQAYALAIEGQGSYNFQDFGMAPPPGVVFGVGFSSAKNDNSKGTSS